MLNHGQRSWWGGQRCSFCRCGLRQCIRSITGLLVVLCMALNMMLHVTRTSGDPKCPSTRFEMLSLLSRELEGSGIAWFVHYGTLLGAVRDEQIIPWTNDVDVCVPHRTSIAEADFMKNLTCVEVSNYESSIARLHPKGAQIERFSVHWFWFSRPVYIDIYHLFNCSEFGEPFNCTNATSPHKGVYLVGSCHEQANRNMRWCDIFPINQTGANVKCMSHW